MQSVKQEHSSVATHHAPLAARHAPLATFALTLLILGLTLPPDLTWAYFGVDGGELITASVTLGIPHPPGYPTYVLLGKLFSQLPVGTVAWRFHLFSALAVALAAALVTRLAQNAGASFPARLAAGLTLPLMPLVWGQATIAEVYGLNLACVAAFLWAWLGERPLWLIGLLFGLGTTAHPTTWLLLPLVALAAIPRKKGRGRFGLGLALGLTPWLALPWLAQSGSPVIWGQPTTLAGGWWLVSGHLYQPNLLALPAAELPARLWEWGQLLAAQLAWLGWLVLVWGYTPSLNKNAKDFWPRIAQINANKNFRPFVANFCLLAEPAASLKAGWLGATAVLYLLYALLYNSSDAQVLLLPALLLVSVLLIPGLQRLGWLALALPLGLLLLNFPQHDQGRLASPWPYGHVRPIAAPLLQAMPAQALVLTPGDQTIFALWYFQHVEGQRPDLVLVDSNLLAFDWYRQRLQQRYPDLQRLDEDNLAAFRQENGQRPFCTVSLAKQLFYSCSEKTS